MILNLGCGSNKIPGTINVDVEESCKPDVIANFKESLPYADGTVDKVLFFHVIEHIEKRDHEKVLNEIFRVLKPEGTFIVSYPEFRECAKNYLENYRGMRDFWEATIYGRQLYPSDYHVSLMDTQFFKLLLENVGFKDIKCAPEAKDPYNTVVHCKKGTPLPTYEELLRNEVFGDKN